MVKYFSVIFPLFVLVTVSLSAQGASPQIDQKITAPIRDVVVYPDRAMVTRVGSVSVKSGKQTLRFLNGNANLDTQSLRAHSQNQKVTVLGITSYPELNTQAYHPEVKKWEDSIRSLENKNASAEKHLERLKKDLLGIDQYSRYLSYYVSETSTDPIQVSGLSSDPKKNAGQEWKQALSILSNRRIVSRNALQETERSIAKTDEEIALLQKKLAQIQSLGQKTNRTIEIHLHSETAQETEISFSYVVYNATWNVSYNMTLGYGKSRDQTLIEYFGSIVQTTGEDWNAVQLYLSTQSPALGGKREKIQPLRVSSRIIATQESYVQTEQTVSPIQSMSNDLDEIAGSEPIPSVETGGFSGIEKTGEKLVFAIPGKVTIPSSERHQKVTIAEFSEPHLERIYKITPSLQTSAHLTQRMKNSRSFPLLSGSVNAFRDHGFIGTSKIAHTPPGQDFIASFGIDRSISITRTRKTYREPAGPMRSGKVFHTELETTVTNESDEPKIVAAQERIPVSEVEEIRVEIQSSTARGYQETSPGILEWKLTLPARNKQSFRLHYRVTTPETYPGEIYGQ